MSVTVSQLHHIICRLKDKQAVNYSSQFHKHNTINHEYELMLPFRYLRFYALLILGANIIKFKVTYNLIFQFLTKNNSNMEVMNMSDFWKCLLTLQVTSRNDTLE